ncbi:unnamed protein product, partial [Amoebophrya sp. A25]|eukprot:GSA25T00011606001.1
MRFAAIRNPLWTFDVVLVDDSHDSWDFFGREKEDTYHLEEPLKKLDAVTTSTLHKTTEAEARFFTTETSPSSPTTASTSPA